MKTQVVAIIRQRGQLTIPDEIRELRPWATPSSVVAITSEKPDEIIIKPHSFQKKQLDWEKLWKQMRRVRAFKGKGRGNLSEFIAKDRETHF